MQTITASYKDVLQINPFTEEFLEYSKRNLKGFSYIRLPFSEIFGSFIPTFYWRHDIKTPSFFIMEVIVNSSGIIVPEVLPPDFKKRKKSHAKKPPSTEQYIEAMSIPKFKEAVEAFAVQRGATKVVYLQDSPKVEIEFKDRGYISKVSCPTTFIRLK
jgi:hypothetical protein